MTPDEMQGIRREVMAAWPQAQAWEDYVWKTWQRELSGFTADELRAAVQRLARNGSAHPPGWGQVYRQAAPARQARLARQAEQRWLTDGEVIDAGLVADPLPGQELHVERD